MMERLGVVLEEVVYRTFYFRFSSFFLWHRPQHEIDRINQSPNLGMPTLCAKVDVSLFVKRQLFSVSLSVIGGSSC